MDIDYLQIHMLYLFAQFCIVHKKGLNIVLRKKEEEEEEKVNISVGPTPIPCGASDDYLWWHRLF